MTTRKERREQAREVHKDYEVVAKAVREALEDLPDGDFKSAITTGLGKLDLDAHPNNAIAAQLILGCIDNVRRNEEAIARLMLYMSGTVVDRKIAEIVLAKIFH